MNNRDTASVVFIAVSVFLALALLFIAYSLEYPH